MHRAGETVSVGRAGVTNCLPKWRKKHFVHRGGETVRQETVNQVINCVAASMQVAFPPVKGDSLSGD